MLPYHFGWTPIISYAFFELCAIISVYKSGDIEANGGITPGRVVFLAQEEGRCRRQVLEAVVVEAVSVVFIWM